MKPTFLRVAFWSWFTLVRPFADGRSPAERWTEECGRLLGDRGRRILERFTRSRLRAYQILPLDHRKGVRLWDLLAGREILVERDALAGALPVWTVVVGRPLQLDGRPVLLPGTLTFPASLKRRLLDVFRKTDDETARARLVHGLAREVHDDPPPAVVTLQGEPVQRLRAFFDVRDPAAAAEILAVLDDVFEDEEASGQYTWEGIPWDEEHTNALGILSLRRERLVLECLTARRLEEGKKFLAASLGPLLEHREDHAFPCRQGAATRLEWERPDERPIAPHMEDDLVLDFVRDQLHAWPDVPLGWLDGLTPRKACSTSEGRAAVAEWLRESENREARRLRSRESDYDFAWLWEAVGMDPEEGL
jgi:hypothetical protein